MKLFLSIMLAATFVLDILCVAAQVALESIGGRAKRWQKWVTYVIAPIGMVVMILQIFDVL